MSIVRTFRTVRRALAPRWLTEGEGELVGYSLDLVKDAFVERARLGLLARFPQNGPNGETAPSDALDALGRDRKLPRGISETDAAYAVRLAGWLDNVRDKGSAFALLRQLRAYMGAGTAFRVVDNAQTWHSLAVDGTESRHVIAGAVDSNADGYLDGTWNWDGRADKWSRFWVVIYPGSVWTTCENYGDASRHWGDGVGTYGLTATVNQVQTVRSIVNDWKPRYTRCVAIIVALDPTEFGPASLVNAFDGTWGHWSKVVGGVRVASRSANARYIDGNPGAP